MTHHERWDGRGYPHRLAGTDIPLSGRIVAIVDCFDALTMDRCYRPAIADAQAMQMLREQRGRAYDPQLVDVFEAALPQMVALRDAVDRVEPTFAELVEGVPAVLPGAVIGDTMPDPVRRLLEAA